MSNNKKPTKHQKAEKAEEEDIDYIPNEPMFGSFTKKQESKPVGKPSATPTVSTTAGKPSASTTAGKPSAKGTVARAPATEPVFSSPARVVSPAPVNNSRVADRSRVVIEQSKDDDEDEDDDENSVTSSRSSLGEGKIYMCVHCRTPKLKKVKKFHSLRKWSDHMISVHKAVCTYEEYCEQFQHLAEDNGNVLSLFGNLHLG